jgi:hypothetical protein
MSSSLGCMRVRVRVLPIAGFEQRRPSSPFSLHLRTQHTFTDGSSAVMKEVVWYSKKKKKDIKRFPIWMIPSRFCYTSCVPISQSSSSPYLFTLSLSLSLSFLSLSRFACYRA